MARAKFQVIVLPFYIDDNTIKYCIFHRSSRDIWQFISGGGENVETCLMAAKRECSEEANISADNQFFMLDSMCTIPVQIFGEVHTKNWGENCFVIPEFSFAVKLDYPKICLSKEHTAFEWVDYTTAITKLKFDSNKTALYELDTRIAKDMLTIASEEK